ncbi:hypothetical protein NM208_g3636 [Fusarium decemcellulare]|uniref:Uncharacterized protein n=1 Tax=Fusarium decemcellulare TaxID=57161 RepID=A0ACC1SNL5_9HYPO|nr:hypothetical protein NM208_g3636 [Fusarium decemcellulare]
MHSFRNLYGLVAIALLIGSTAGGPCKPLSSTTMSLTTTSEHILSSTVESVSEASATSSATGESSTETATSTYSETVTETSTSTTYEITTGSTTETITTSTVETTTSTVASTTTTTSEGPVVTPAGQTFGIKAARSQDGVINGAVLHVNANPGYALYLINPPRTSGSLLPGSFSIEDGTGRLMVGSWYVYTNGPDPYSMYAATASGIPANFGYITCVKPLLVGDSLQCSSDKAGPIYFSVTAGASAANIMPWKVGSVHSGYSTIDLVVA